MKLARRYPALFSWGAATFVILALVAAAPVVAPYDPNRLNMGQTLKPPSSTNLFGTDEVGRDLFSRVLYGGRESIVAALVVIGAAVALGILVGATSGWIGGRADEVLMRVTDLFFAFPPLILAMAIAAAL